MGVSAPSLHRESTDSLIYTIYGNCMYYAGINPHGVDVGSRGGCRIGEVVGGVIATYLVVTVIAILFWWKWR